jgi:DNA primase
MSPDAVEQIKSRLNIMDIVENYIKLTKAGKNFKALSPFTNEKTPSFFVSPDQGLYYCFSSGKGGDMFTFVQEMEGVDFAGALKILAERAGVELKPQNPKLRDEREKLFVVLEAATRYYENLLRNQPKVIEYLKSRGIVGTSAKKFRIGYAPESWRGLHDHLSSRGFDSSVMEKAGLVVRSTKGYYDRFRGRIMFPIFNNSGVPVAFSGRIFSVSGAPEDKTAKYVNSPETSLYNKSEILYGFDKAKQAIRNRNSCVLVEGQIDLVLAHQTGTDNTVAVSGTALSRQHLAQIKRITEDIIFAFDADDAGISAAGRGIDLALTEGFEVRVANMPHGKDPADLINKDVKEWKKVILGAQHVIDFHLDVLCNKNKDSRNTIRAVEKTVLPYVAKLRSSIDQAHFISKIADKLGVAENSIWEELKKIKHQPNADIQDTSDDLTQGQQRVMSRKDKIKEKILGIFLWQSGVKSPNIDPNKTKEEYEKITKDMDFLNKDVSAEERSRLVSEAGAFSGQKGSTQEKLDDLFLNLKKEILKEKSSALHRELQKVENDENEEILGQIQKNKREREELDNTSAEVKIQ